MDINHGGQIVGSELVNSVDDHAALWTFQS